jgi:HNH endonuclease
MPPKESKRRKATSSQPNNVEPLQVLRKRVKAQPSFNASFWIKNAVIEREALQQLAEERKVSFQNFLGTEAEWADTEAAKAIFERVRAQELQLDIMTKQARRLDTKGKKRRGIRASFMALFTTSKMGQGIAHTGAGERPKNLQWSFRTDLIKEYIAKHPKEDWVWCPITSTWWPRAHTRAAHLFAYMHGQEVMDSIFGRTNPPELFSPKNGILVYQAIEECFDKGKLL